MAPSQSHHSNVFIVNSTINYERVIEDLIHSKLTNLKQKQDFNNQMRAKEKVLEIKYQSQLKAFQIEEKEKNHSIKRIRTQFEKEKHQRMLQLQKNQDEKMFQQLLKVQQQHEKITFQRMIQAEREKYESNLKLIKDENELLRYQLKQQKQTYEEKIESILVNNATTQQQQLKSVEV